MQEVISFVYGAFATVILIKLSNSAQLILLSEHVSNSAAAYVELSPSLTIGARVVTHAALILMTARCSRHTQRFDAEPSQLSSRLHDHQTQRVSPLQTKPFAFSM